MTVEIDCPLRSVLRLSSKRPEMSERKQNREKPGIEFGQDVEYGRPWG